MKVKIKNEHRMLSVRMVESLYEALRGSATDMGRSVNQELCVRISQSLSSIKRVINEKEIIPYAAENKDEQLT